MKSGNKPFFYTFGLTLGGVLVILGCVQAFFGTMRLINPAEEEYEATRGIDIYTVSPVEKNIFYFSSVIEGKKQKDAVTYIEQNSEKIENALRSMPPKKAEKVLQKIQEIQNSKKESVTSQVQDVPIESEAETREELPFISPVILEVTPENATPPKGYEKMIYTVAGGPFFRTSLWDFPIVIDTKRASPRGQVHNEKLMISGSISSLNEAAKVLVHELGHMVDVYLLIGKKNTPDPSDKFYEISWKERTVMKSQAKSKDFISGYGATNQYEDFAEAFTFYIFHNTEFEKRGLENKALQQKYDFFRSLLGTNFIGTAYEKNVIPESFWDVTKITLNTSNLSNIFATLSAVWKLL